jgi:hypothetical protein
VRNIPIKITSYETLLAVAKKQPEPQRFLFVFLKVTRPDEATEEEMRRFDAGQGGFLDPIMCVDKDLNELTSFADLVEESKQVGQEWQMVLIAILAGKNGVAPSSEVAEEPLKKMVRTVQEGGDLSPFLMFDSNGDPVIFDRK